MKFEDAIEKSIKSFLKGNMPEELMKVQGDPVIYTPEYMDELEEDLADMEPRDEDEVEDV
jgi:hypothetical protein